MTGYGKYSFCRRNLISRGILAAVWMSGLMTGSCLWYCRQNMVREAFCKALCAPISRIGGYFLPFLPLFLSILVVYANKPCWIYPICFIRAVTFSLTVSGVISALSLIGGDTCRFDAFYLYMGRLMEYWFWRRHVSGIMDLHPIVLLLLLMVCLLLILSRFFLFYGNTY